MSSSVKKGLAITGIVVAVILALMIFIPFFFKDKIKDIVVDMANKNLNAEVVIEGFGLNLFSNFPNATLSLNNASVAGIDQFKGDTLLRAKSASVTIDLFSLFSDNYKVNKISLEGTSIYAKIAENGKANWDIVKTDSTTTSTADQTEASPFNLALKNITIKEADIVYEDFESNIKAYIYGWNGTIKGDFSATETTLKTKSTIDQLTVMMDAIPYLSKVKVDADASINADFEKMKFTFADSKFLLNDLEASIDGSFAFVGEEGLDFDLKLKAPGADFKQILSLVPAMYTNDFKDVKAKGEVSLDAYIIGRMEGDVYPAFDLRLKVTDAMFQYPSLPKSVDNINLILSVNGEGGSIDNVMVLVDKFGFTLGGNPFSGSFRMTPALNDRSIKFNAQGKLNLGMIKEVYPLEAGTELNGSVDADIRVATTISAIEKELYESISAEGHIKLSDMTYKSADLPEVKINTAALEFTPQYANLKELSIVIGKSDIQANGRLENFIAYILKDKTLRGSLNIQSKYLNLDELMGNDEAAKATETDERSEDVIIPKNIDFALSAGLSHVVYDKIDITNLLGTIAIKDGILSMKNVSATALGGSANINGAYDTSEPKEPKVNFDLDLTKVSFAQTFKSVEAIQKFAPIFQDIIGTYSMKLKFNTKLESTMSQTLMALTGGGSLLTSDVTLENNKTLSAIGSALNYDKLNSISPKDLNLPFELKDGGLITKPFNVDLGNGGEMMLEGVTKLDQTIDYKGTVKLPKSLNNNFISKIPLTIGGTFASPKIAVDLKAAATDAIGNIVGGLLGGGKGDGESGDLTTKATEEKAKQIERIRNEADKAAAKLVDVAKTESDKLVEKTGSNPISKAVAKAAAKKLVDEAEKQAKKVRDDAEEQIKKIEGGEAATEAETAK